MNHPSRLQACWPAARIGLLLLLSLTTVVPEAIAAGEITDGGKVNQFLIQIRDALVYVSITVVTIAFIFSGYQIAFAHKRITDVAPVLVGAVIIGAAAQLANWFIGGYGA